MLREPTLQLKERQKNYNNKKNSLLRPVEGSTYMRGRWVGSCKFPRVILSLLYVISYEKSNILGCRYALSQIKYTLFLFKKEPEA